MQEVTKTKRKSIRLKDYDYSEPGDYFITICAQDKKCLFGEIINCEIMLNDVGKMIEKWWGELKNKFSNILLDEFIIMPNHIHAIITLIEAVIETVGATLCGRPQKEINTISAIGQPHRAAPTIGNIIDWFKTMTTNKYIQNVKTKNWPPFEKRLWQRNYYEHITRDENNLDKIRDYIISNPGKWTEDKENPNYKRSL